MDYAGGVEEADRLIVQFPRSRELAAWRVANLARVDRPQEATLEVSPGVCMRRGVEQATTIDALGEATARTARG
jgi:hypothetical protein